MTKNNILIELWEKTQKHFENDIYIDFAKERFLNYGMKKTKKDLQQIYNLYCYGYYNKNEKKLYYDIIN